MAGICEADVKAALGNTDAFVLQELVRTKASSAELHRALEFAQDSLAGDFIACLRFPSRVQRLIDLLLVELTPEPPRKPQAGSPNHVVRDLAA